MREIARISIVVFSAVALSAPAALAQVLPEIEDAVQKIAARAGAGVWLVEAEPDAAKFKLTPPAGGAYRYVKRGVAFAWDAEAGLLITSHSVVSDARLGSTVVLAQRDRRIDAQVLGTDAETDVALLKVGTGQLSRVLPLGAAGAKTGAFAVALGPDLVPLRLSQGWVNHTDMRLPGYREPLVVINIAVDAGAAGTPVFGSDGRVMGMIYAGGFGRPAVSWTLVQKSAGRAVINAVAEPHRRADGQQEFVVRMPGSSGGVAIGVAGAAAAGQVGLTIQVRPDGSPQIVLQGNGRDQIVTDLKQAAGGVEWTDIGFGNSPATAMIGGSGPPAYVVPVEVIRGVLDDLRNHKQVRRGQLGVILMDSPATTARAGGALVYRIIEGGPAATAGIKAGDVVVSVAGKSIPDAGELIRTVRSRRDGDSVDITVLSADGKPRTCSVRLSALSVWAAGADPNLRPAGAENGNARPVQKAEIPPKKAEPQQGDK
jgi:S1-C subfamily serine protease